MEIKIENVKAAFNTADESGKNFFSHFPPS